MSNGDAINNRVQLLVEGVVDDFWTCYDVTLELIKFKVLRVLRQVT
jgi:hypothetical protein